MKITAIYIRVSTEAQREEGYSIEAQTEALTAYCTAKGWRTYELYIDGGYSGSSLERPAIQRLIHDVKNSRIERVLVYKLDRLSRSQKDTLYLIEDILNPHEVDFISLNESMDTGSPMGRLMLGILSAFAQLERENIRERTRMGMAERVKAGYWMGGGKIPYGYDYDAERGILVPNGDADTVARMYRWYLQGYSPAEIAELTGFRYERQDTFPGKNLSGAAQGNHIRRNLYEDAVGNGTPLQQQLEYGRKPSDRTGILRPLRSEDALSEMGTEGTQAGLLLPAGQQILSGERSGLSAGAHLGG